MLERLTKRGLSALLVLIMVLSMLPFSAFATEAESQAPQDSSSAIDLLTEEEPAETKPAEEPEPTEAAVVAETYPNTEDDGHEHVAIESERVPALCEDDGMTSGTYCQLCGVTLSGREVIPALGHNVEQYDAKLPTFSKVGWEAYEDCTRCGYSTYVEIPMLEKPVIEDYETFLLALFYLEELANAYAMEHPGTDPLNLIIKYIRTGVDRYNSGSWGIMAGYEDAGFAKYVADIEDMLNAEVGSIEEMFCITSLKNIKNFYLPNGELTDIGHMFGTMDITYHNNFGVNHADVGGWAGDLVDLLEFSDYSGISGSLEEMVAQINEETFLVTAPENVGGFNTLDLIGDLDAMYLMNQLKKEGYHYEYEVSGLAINLMMYFTEDLSMVDRAEYFLKNRMDGITTRNDLREAVYNAYTTNKVITTLEGTREFQSADLDTLRRAVCYTYADFICKLAGDYVEDAGNNLFTVFSTENATLAPGITQQIKMATTAEGKQIVYYLATGDLTRGDVSIYANYHNNDPSQGWEMQRVLDQANAAQERHSDPNSEHYIENYNVIAAVNGAGFNMSTGQPSGLLVMEGITYSPVNGDGFFGILKDGTPVIASTAEYNSIYKDQVQEGIACFGSRLIKDGKIIEGLSNDNASRTAVGITKTGKVVFLVLDGRQEPFSAGGGYATLAQILLEAGCVEATNLDGGGSTTFVAKQPGDDALSVINRPSDGFARSVSTSLIMVSTAPSSTAFDHAVIENDYDYLSVGATQQMSAVGISPSGNTVDIPEGAVWAVSDEKKASITADGLFTALANGDVDVYLMLDGNVIGSKSMHIVSPDNIYYSKSNLDMVFGETKELPVKVLYQGKEMAFVASDIVFTLSNKQAGSVSGISFTATSNENVTVTGVTVTASLVVNPDAAATIKVALYKQGELSFDFEQATGGDRQLAWHRDVSNSVTDDNSVYTVVDPSQDMVTSYILAIDMTQIPIPARLEELTYMLPGSDIAGASAWTFLCQLAERISVLSEIKATVQFDSNLSLDISEMKLINDYFYLAGAEVDEETSTLTLTLKWKKQTQAINADNANPMCIVNGLKLIPKADAQWDSKNQLKIVNAGDISYKIYMRASALYSFSQKPENQQVFGLYSYINPDDSYDKGGYFQDTYKEFYDSYTLVNQLKEGWYNEDGGFTYYAQGVKYTGVKKVDDLYYNFGENGVLAAKNAYTGLFLDEAEQVYRYSYLGKLASGWYQVEGNWHYFDSKTMAAANGTLRVDKVLYEFEPTGKLVSGVWKNAFTGWRYYYGPSYVKKNWYQIDGQWYFFKDGCRVTGVQKVASQESVVHKLWYSFDENGVSQGLLTGFIEEDGILYYCENGKPKEKGLFLFEGNYYFSKYDGSLITNQKYYAWKIDSSCDLPKGHYEFDELGRLLGNKTEEQSGIVNKDGVLYYYENGKAKEKGLFCVDGNYYYALYDGSLVCSQKYYAWKIDSSSQLPKGHYEFGADGKMLNGIVDLNGVLYYYENGNALEKGLFYMDGAYYLAQGKGLLAVSQKCYAWKVDSSCTLPSGNYEFGADGKMLDGIVDKNGVLYYYELGLPVEKGLFYMDGNHYFSKYDGSLVVDQKYYAWNLDSSSQLPVAHYEFDAEGKVIGQSLTGEIVNKNGILYYYEAGQPKEKGLFCLDGSYYYSVYDGSLILNQKYYAWSLDSSSQLPVGHYEFGADGKLLAGIIDKAGTLYFYENGKPVDKGFFCYEGGYYFSLYNGALVTNQKYYVWKVDASCDLPKGHYEFDASGRMIDGIVEKDGVLYYYENGKPVEKGMFFLDGYYYFSKHDGSLVTNQKYYVWKVDASCDLPKANYEFDENGRMLDGIVSKNGVLYYYENGAAVDKGLFYLDGHYYFTRYDGALITNCTYYVWKGNDLLVEKNYIFNELGQIVG